jgi:hypothetical protein
MILWRLISSGIAQRAEAGLDSAEKPAPTTSTGASDSKKFEIIKIYEIF